MVLDAFSSILKSPKAMDQNQITRLVHLRSLAFDVSSSTLYIARPCGSMEYFPMFFHVLKQILGEM